MAEVICPVCGLANPAEALTCFNCFSPLGTAIRPGEAPTKKGTGELEPILPEWLRTVREKSRQSTGSEIEEPEEKAQPISDLLAGLEAQSKSDEEDEVPNWLSNITGATGRKKDEPEHIGPHRVEMGRPGAYEEPDTQPAKPAPRPSAPVPEDETPPWLKALAETDKDDGADRLEDWFKQAAGTGAEAAPEALRPTAIEETGGAQETETRQTGEQSLEWPGSLQSESAASDPTRVETDLLEWLNSLDSPASDASSADVPDWLQHLDAPPPEKITLPESLEPAGLEPLTGMESAAPEAELPDWLKDLRQETTAGEQAQEGAFRTLEPDQLLDAGAEAAVLPAMEAELPDWLENLKAEEPPQENIPTAAAVEPEALEAELPDWLRDLQPDSEKTPLEEGRFAESSLQEETPSEPIQTESISATLEVELPDWLDQLGKEPAAAQEAELPEWLSGAIAVEPGEADAAVEQPGVIEEAEMPEWAAALAAEVPAAEPPAEAETEPVLEPEPLPQGELSTLFTGVPDWLEEAETSEVLSEDGLTMPAAEEAGAISPVELPAWVQAMRPVEATLGPAVAGEEEEEMMETSGPLAGLRGVLPSFVYPGPASKPRSQSIKLQPSEEQLGHAALLEQILQAETKPEPMAAPAALAPLRGLRLGIGLALLLALMAAIFAGTNIVPLPSGRPAETLAALEAIEAVPANAAALIVFDYEPSLAGEMEAAAAPLLDHLIVLKAPRLTLLSTSPTGSALAERMMSRLEAQEYTNLGYLAGGLGGVRSFAQDPAAAMPLQADATPWTAPALENIQHMADYGAIIVITDSADSGRTWIEQAANLIGPDRFVIVASAQAGPMLQPYHQAGQIRGLVTGLFDSAVLEQNNAGRPGLARRYWDAYNLGLILAVVLLVVGAAWNLAQGIRERAAAQEAD